MSSEAVKLAKIQRSQARQAVILDIARSVATNPIALGLAALAANQAAYRLGLWDPRPDPDGQYRTWKPDAFKVDAGGVTIGGRTWTTSSKEEIAAQNATIIGDMIIAATIAFSAAGGGGSGLLRLAK